MLGPDLVRVRRRGEKLVLQKLSGAEREEALRISDDLAQLLLTAEGLSLEEVTEMLGSVTRQAKHEKLWAGLKKLTLDACEFGSPVSVDASELRLNTFRLASERRRQATTAGEFSRDVVLAEVAKLHDVAVEDVESGLFSDLKGAALLTHAPRLEARTLVERYELAQIQGVLLRAVRLTVTVDCGSPDALRALFHKLKFRRLLYRLERLEDGKYSIEIEGPFSLFESVTKYGLQLALLVPAFRTCRSAHLVAEVRWGKERRSLTFETPLDFAGDEGDERDALRSEVATLLESLQRKKSAVSVTLAQEMFDVPGVGLCIPDLRFETPEGRVVHLEVLGFWSRDAVFRRVEWAEAQKEARVLFAVSSRLRVKKEVLPEESGSALYVYKGTMNAATVLAQVEELASRA